MLKNIVVYYWVLLICLLCFNAQAQDKTYVYAWSDNSKASFKDRIITTCRVGLHSSPSQRCYSIIDDIEKIAADLKQMPRGNRVVQVWLPKPYIDLLTNNKADELDNQNAQKFCEQYIGYNLFWDRGAFDIGKLFDKFYKELRDRGVIVDYIVLDIEKRISNWEIRRRVTRHSEGVTVETRNKVTESFQYIIELVRRNDDSLPKFFNEISPEKIVHGVYDNRSNYIAFNNYFQTRLCEYLNIAFYYPARKYFPNVKCSNFNEFLKLGNYEIPNRFGHKVYAHGKGCYTGTNQSPPLYGRLSPSILKYAPSKGNTGKNFQGKLSGFDALLYDTNLLKSLKKDNSAPVSPFIAYRSYSDHSCLIGGTDYYQENLFHILLSNCKQLLFWNPKSKDGYAEEKLVYNCLQQVDSLLGFTSLQERIPDSQESITWNNNYVLSKINVPKGSLWRLTPNWNLLGGVPRSKREYKSKAFKNIKELTPLTFKIEDQEIVFPLGASLVFPSQNLSLAGYWIYLEK